MNSETESIQEFEAVFSKLKGMLNLTDEIMIRLYTAFYDTGAVTLSKLKDAVEIKDYDAMRLHAHTIKGSASSLCYDAISDLANNIEEKAKLKESCEYTELFSALVAEFETGHCNYTAWKGKRS